MAETFLPVQIERGVPMPVWDRGASTRIVQAMQPGDSVLITYNQRGSLLTMANRLGFVMRSKREGEKYRVWMIGPKAAKGDTTKEGGSQA